MPRDTTALLEAPPDLTKPTLEGLSWLLRHREAWPEGFEWDFYDCRTCAMGLLTRIVFGAPFTTLEYSLNWIQYYFGMDRVSSRRIFRIGRYPDTPEAIADLIDEYLAKR